MIKIIDNKKFSLVFIVISIVQRLFYKSEIEYLIVIHFTHIVFLEIIDKQ